MLVNCFDCKRSITSPKLGGNLYAIGNLFLNLL